MGQAGHLVATALTAREGKGPDSDCTTTLVTHALTAEGHDASEDGTGRGTPLVPWMDTAATLTAGVSSDGVSAPGRRQEDEHNIVPWTVSNDSQPVVVRDGTGSLKVGTGLGIPSAPAVAWPLAVRGREGGAQLEVGPPDGPYNALRAADGGSSRTPMVATAFAENQRGEVVTSDTAGSLKTGGGKPGQGYPAAMVGTAVRRLTPLECERLMGWPDNHTNVPGTSDSARYKQCGNGIAAPVAEWIGWRLKAYVEGWRP